MLLQKLVEYALDRIEQTPPLYADRPIRYIVELDADGSPLSLTDTADRSDRRTRNGASRLAPQIQRTVAIKPLLLADRADYTFGRMRTADNSEGQAAKRYSAYMDVLERCAIATKEPVVKAVLYFLDNDPLNRLALPDDFDESASFTFRVDGSFVIDLPAIQQFWAREHSLDGNGSGEGVRCLVCGRQGPVLERLQAKIKGIPGGQSSGTTLISANEEAFESYGLEASQVAPTCESCGELFTKALNELLATEGNSYRIGGSGFVFWTREETPFSVRSFFDRPDPEEVRNLIASARTGKRAAPDETAFYAASLTGSGGRAVVRDWMDTTVANVKRSLSQWFRMQRIVNWDNSEPRPLNLYQIAGATVRDMRDLSPTTPRALLRTALTGTPLTNTLLYQAVRRNRAEQKLTHPRAALIKLVLMSQARNYQEDDMVSLNEEHPSPAYHCGRLLAELEAAQRGAIPGAKATITDRFYGTASTAPASVLPRLLRGAQPHLSKLERDRPGAYHALTRRIEEICARILTFPKTLTLEGQGLFSLGYYHQRAHDRAAAAEARARREGADQSTEDLTEE